MSTEAGEQNAPTKEKKEQGKRKRQQRKKEAGLQPPAIRTTEQSESHSLKVSESEREGARESSRAREVMSSWVRMSEFRVE